MKKTIFFLSALFFFFSASAEFFGWRKSGVSCGTGQAGYDCLFRAIQNNTVHTILNVSDDYFLDELAHAFNRQTGYQATRKDARKAFLDGQFFVINWPVSDLMNSGLDSKGRAHYFPMAGRDSVQIIASRDLTGRVIPLIKLQSSNKNEPCYNICYSKSIQPYKEEKQAIAFADLPVASAIVAEERLIQLNYWPQQPFQMAVIPVNQVQVVQPAIVFLPNKQCCNNVVSQPTPVPNPGGNGHPIEGDPGWGPTVDNGNGTPIEAEPGWGTTSGNGNPVNGDPGWGGYSTTNNTQTNPPTNWPVNIGNNNGGNTGGNNNGGNNNGGPVE